MGYLFSQSQPAEVAHSSFGHWKSFWWRGYPGACGQVRGQPDGTVQDPRASTTEEQVPPQIWRGPRSPVERVAKGAMTLGWRTQLAGWDLSGREPQNKYQLLIFLPPSTSHHCSPVADHSGTASSQSPSEVSFLGHRAHSSMRNDEEWPGRVNGRIVAQILPFYVWLLS